MGSIYAVARMERRLALKPFLSMNEPEEKTLRPESEWEQTDRHGAELIEGSVVEVVVVISELKVWYLQSFNFHIDKLFFCPSKTLIRFGHTKPGQPGDQYCAAL